MVANCVSYPYATLSTRLTVKSGQDATAVAKNTADLIKATLNVVNPAYQNDDGGWGKTNTAYDLLNDTFATLCNPAHSTFDNGSTHGHMKFLAAVLRLAKENPVLDGASTTIIFAKKERGHYSIIECYLQPFGLLPVWRKKITTSNKLDFRWSALPNL